MKKSFKRIVAVLLAVMMIVCSFPLTVLAADSNRTNINLQFGDVSNKSTPKNYIVDRRGATIDKFANYSGLNSTKLEYSNGKIAGYNRGDFFTVSVLVENVSKIAAAEVAIKYSDSISPAYIKSVNNGTAVFEYTESGSAIDGFQPLEAITQQSGDAIHNKTNTLGETSYVDADKKIIHAKFAVQSGSDYADTSIVTAGKQNLTNTAVLATFMFKIVSDDAITFSIDTSDEAYYLETIANGGKVDEYKTYVPKSEGAEAELDFMGKNEYNGSTSTSYTITFNDENGKVLQTGSYEEGTDVTAPALPAVTHDNEKHYTYSWDKEVVSPAAADATYTRVKTGAVHEWNQGVVTKEPTTTETGIKTYTCTFKGCNATKTEVLPKKEEETHVHTWGEWVYNNDAVYNKDSKLAVDGTATRKCTVTLADGSKCTETETKTIAGTGQLRANTATVTLGAAVVLNTGIDVSRQQKFASSYIEIMFDGKPYKLTEISKDNTTATRNFYDFDMISPDKFGDEITVTAYGVTEDGIVCKGHSIKYSIKQYCYNTYGRATTGDSLKTLLVELLYYGKDYQLYRNYKTDQLITSSMTEEQHSRHTTDIPTYTKVTNPNFESNPNGSDANEIYFKAATMELQGKVIPQVKIELSKTRDIRDYTFTWIINGKSESFTYDEHPDWLTPTNASKNTEDVNNAYLVNCHVLKANQFSIPFDIIVTKNGKQVSNKLRYSVESYTFSGAYKADTKLKNLVDQLLRYGRADVQYVGNTN